MPFSRNIFTRKTKNEADLNPSWSKGLELPKSPRSPTSPKSPKSPKSTKPLTFTRQNTEHLNQCRGCDNIEDLIRWNTAYSRNGEARLSPALLHHSFAELESCAGKCQICRVFRQSLLQEEVTFHGITDLRGTKGRVHVCWVPKSLAQSETNAYLTIEIEDRPGHKAVVNCNRKSEISHLALRPDARDTAIMEQARAWLHECLHNHVGSCDNLRFSREKPELLIEIISPGIIRLSQNQSAEYVALSYCWGPETDQIERGKTKDRNLKERFKNFSSEGLPATIQDALYIVYNMGFRYAWIDSLCINQSTFKGVETMHKVYSNALFTICACATSKASGKLLDLREAWTLRTEPCQLGGEWLTTPDMSLNELRLRSPLARRAWTLQEERLSPRMLYVSSSRVYWSCALSDKIELAPTYEDKATKMQRPVYGELDRRLDLPLAQTFLMACYSRNEELYSFWADIVKSFASRTMSSQSDRLDALAGLAAKYLSANAPDEYLAGLWANNLTEGLGWKVQRAVTYKENEANGIPNQWPSWSWARLPLQTTIDMRSRSTRSVYFQRYKHGTSPDLRIVIDVEDSIKRGAKVKELCVTGRLRALWQPSSYLVSWSDISRSVQGEEKFTFAANPERNMHSIHEELGRILVYEDRQRQIVGQLDFQHDISAAGDLGIMAFEIGETELLLLSTCGRGIYRRVGVAWDVRINYFALAERADVIIR